MEGYTIVTYTISDNTRLLLWWPTCACGWKGVARSTKDKAQDAIDKHVNRKHVSK